VTSTDSNLEFLHCHPALERLINRSSRNSQRGTENRKQRDLIETGHKRRHAKQRLKAYEYSLKWKQGKREQHLHTEDCKDLWTQVTSIISFLPSCANEVRNSMKTARFCDRRPTTQNLSCVDLSLRSIAELDAYPTSRLDKADKQQLHDG
jgi:hypothetical protein